MSKTLKLFTGLFSLLFLTVLVSLVGYLIRISSDSDSSLNSLENSLSTNKASADVPVPVDTASAPIFYSAGESCESGGGGSCY